MAKKLLLLLVFCAAATALFAIDTTKRVKPYTPYYQWDTIPDTLALQYKEKYPDRWYKDSVYYAGLSKAFADSLMNDSSRRRFITSPVIPDSVTQGFTYSELPPVPAGKPAVKPVSNWVLWVILLVLLSLVFLKLANFSLFYHLFLSFFSIKRSEEVLKEQDSSLNLYNLMATLVFSLIYALFFFQLLVKGDLLLANLNQLVAFIVIFIAIALFFLLKYLFILLSGVVLEAEYTYSVLIQTTVSGNAVLSIIGIPLIMLANAVLLHLPALQMLFYLAVFSAIYLVLKQVRVFIQSFPTFGYSFVYLIFYLCALEIAPWLVIFKLLQNLTGV